MVGGIAHELRLSTFRRGEASILRGYEIGEGGGLVKVGAKVAGECNFAPTFVRHSRFSSRSSTRAASNIRREYLGRFDFTDRELVCRRRIIVFCVGFCWSGFAPFFLSLSLSPRYFCVFVFDARTKKKFLIGSWARYRSKKMWMCVEESAIFLLNEK